MKGNDNHKPRFVCGIDFGTTFTSVAFAHSTSPNDVTLIQNWPNAPHGTADDVPSELHYTNTRCNPRDAQWGYQIPKDSKDAPEPLKWFKLLLQEHGSSSSLFGPIGLGSAQASASFVSAATKSLDSMFGSLQVSQPTSGTPLERTAAKLKEIQITPEDAMTDFLRNVREHTVMCIEGQYDKDFVSQAKIEYVLTVPAIWTDQAKNTVILAGLKAGLGSHRTDFHLCSEPEAAAVYTFRAIQPHELRVGESFVVCDAGGGTCDLVSYDIENLIPLKLNEAVSGSGDLCGSVYLDQGFDRYIRRMLGNTYVDKMRPKARRQMEQSFERVKTRFGNSNERSLDVNVGNHEDDDDLRIEDGFHAMRPEDFHGIFDPVVNRVISLVKDQVNELQKKHKKVAAILLVGGFGSSKYLKQCLEEQNYGGEIIQVIQPAQAKTAIARGALMRGLDGSIVHEKRSRRYYGCEASCRISAGDIDDTMKKYTHWDPADDCLRIINHLRWFLQKEEIIGDDFSCSHNFQRTFLKSSFTTDDLIFWDDLLACDISKAPDYRWRDPENVYKVCTVRSDLSKIPVSHFRLIRSCRNTEYYRVSYMLKLSLVGEVLKFQLLFNGKPCGTVTAKFQ